MAHEPDVPPLHEPLAELERGLIEEFLTASGEDATALRQRTDDVARRLLTDASAYATAKLAEVECRSHYVRQLHGTE